VCEKFGFANVDQVVDYLGMMGDAVDNIPGLPGVGAKTATSFWRSTAVWKKPWRMPMRSREN
jgi:5'-3' exonuclease